MCGHRTASAVTELPCAVTDPELTGDIVRIHASVVLVNYNYN